MGWYYPHETGLSPRVRGNRAAQADVAFFRGSIPACAGEPRWTRPTSANAMVYPRVCGGTCTAAPTPAGMTGLSPRVRGNHLRRSSWLKYQRSIPACAGEPARRIASSQPPPVYPRVCGGTLEALPDRGEPNGLSPRVRGNLFKEAGNSAIDGSIPACAGEPCRQRCQRHHRAVYPRVCGGTSTM